MGVNPTHAKARRQYATEESAHIDDGSPRREPVKDKDRPPYRPLDQSDASFLLCRCWIYSLNTAQADHT
jgi:hypothetical protein